MVSVLEILNTGWKGERNKLLLVKLEKKRNRNNRFNKRISWIIVRNVNIIDIMFIWFKFK